MTKEAKPKPKKFCSNCEKEKNLSEFYTSNSSSAKDGRHAICKKCITIDFENINDIQQLLMELNKPFLYDLWETSVRESGGRGTASMFGLYLKNVYLNHKNSIWKHSVFESIKTDDNQEVSNIKPRKSTFILSDDIVDKWGFGYLDKEYQAFERKYAMLKNNYQEKTAMHTEALLTYIRYRVKEELATAEGDIRSAKDWGALAQKAAQDAKINPSQLSKSDLSDGLDTFGQLVRSVEQAVDIIPILPQFKERPQDKVDFTLWCYVNYVRDLKGLPIAGYQEVYNFYEERKKEYENRAKELLENEEDDL